MELDAFLNEVGEGSWWQESLPSVPPWMHCWRSAVKLRLEPEVILEGSCCKTVEQGQLFWRHYFNVNRSDVFPFTKSSITAVCQSSLGSQ